MSDLCRDFGISHKTGYKILHRYMEEGAAFTDRSRRPVRYANQPPPQIDALIVRCKKDKPHRGAGKIRELLIGASWRRWWLRLPEMRQDTRACE